MTTITLKVPAQLKHELQAAARRQGVSCSHLLRQAAEQWVNGSRRRGKASLYERSKDLCGVVKRGPSDLASNPKHLRGFGQ
jgi:hypothetical protein